MDKVWVVTSGEYSDYQVERIFSNEEAAERYAETFSQTRYGRQASVVEYPLDADFDVSAVYWHVTFWTEHSQQFIEGHYVERMEALADDQVPGVVEYDEHERPACTYRQWGVIVQAPTEAGALKIAAEQVDQFRAEQAGIA